MNKSILIIAAHSDDEVLGCGGTIARHVDEGDIVNVIFISDGVGSRTNLTQKSLFDRENAALNAKNILGISNIKYLGFPDNKLDSIPILEIIKELEIAINIFQPNIIYTHHYGDLNVDHRLTHQAVLTACRPFPESLITKIYTFEVMSSTDWALTGSFQFIPNTYINITNYIEKKKQALLAYSLEMRNSPNSRSISHIVALSVHRGNIVGFEYAEAFVLIREKQ
jgi:LmbE family N-acetylglucosaminyl deacetylase